MPYYYDPNQINKRSIDLYIRDNHPELGKAEQAIAAKVANAAYRGQTTLRDAGEAGVRYVMDKRENG